ncbi:MAG: hypothetical protein A3G33_00065 [Omnitrophica bacterium RIFCSPLOWO2_12_FULL_44_17]|uniref:YbbR domain pair protein n=1 Tax=Candidatus Danuiimicrobium aquiferis TaxID=1801832 RepID=A0A1G1KT00_9BACT|nr:MAG: hypothetical protein A3B72_10175 [Omnitrophica bacterium RIFCSPHIGHO2_02_FULL_45_28]OGW95975.1 MAG: hypothetical protein A3G33_00065 [Omnitrophica bacterium RIFCSPLOWO2_12_FULL_44_17]OGX01969.1 MAG: hypothetical protein A3J12_04645 [Omnitrophica bacterium RIFCSPLOWO2_02_FULL_44_11]
MKFNFGWLTNNLGLKLISLLLAIGFWYYAVGEESIEVTLMVPLEIRLPSPKLRVSKSSAEGIKITLQSPRQLVPQLSAAKISATHEVAGVEKTGDYSFNLSARDFSIPYPEVRVTKIFPSFVTISIDELITKKLLIDPDLVGDPAIGYRVDAVAIELDPNAILVEGPKTILEKLDKIKTEPIQLVGRVRSFRRSVRVANPPEIRILGEGVSDVQIPIIAEFADQEMKGLAVKPLGSPAPERYAILVEDKVITIIKGPKPLLEKLNPKDILVYVNIEGLKEGYYEIPVTVLLPTDLSLKGDPPTVLVRIRKIE